jgi:hypothetical protein
MLVKAIRGSRKENPHNSVLSYKRRDNKLQELEVVKTLIKIIPGLAALFGINLAHRPKN